VLYHFTKDAPYCTIHETRIKRRLSSLNDRFFLGENMKPIVAWQVSGSAYFSLPSLVKSIRFGLSSRVENLSENVQRGCCSCFSQLIPQCITVQQSRPRISCVRVG